MAATAKADGATQTMGITDPGTTVGTVNYMSPEQARGEPDPTPQSDQFSLGLVLYELPSGNIQNGKVRAVTAFPASASNRRSFLEKR
jgi:serine/threonine protein kinase